MDVVELIQKHSGDVEAALGEIKTKVTETSVRLDELEQKAVRRGGDGMSGGKSWGAQVVSRVDEAKSYFDSRSTRGSTSFELKTTITSAAGSGGDLVAPARDTTLALPQRRLAVRDLLPTIRVTSGSVEYPRQTDRTINAATVAEGALKPESAIAFELVVCRQGS